MLSQNFKFHKWSLLVKSYQILHLPRLVTLYIALAGISTSSPASISPIAAALVMFFLSHIPIIYWFIFPEWDNHQEIRVNKRRIMVS